jgi:hypothetical protein
VGVSSLYSVSVPPGSWAPLNISVTNRGGSNLQGELLVTSPVPQLSGGVPYCYSAGGGATACVGTYPGLRHLGYTFGGFGFGFGSAYSTSTPTSPVSYRLPLDVAPETTKTIPLDVLAAAQPSDVVAEVVSPGGRVLARSGTQVQVGNTSTPPAVLVVTGNPTALSSLSWPVPGGPQPQVQLLSPLQLPNVSAALGGFSAIVLDDADTSSLSPAQGRALEAYVEEGGTLVVAGGLSYASDTAGLPAGLLPVRVLGLRSFRLPELARLVGAPVPSQPAEVDRLRVLPGAATVLSEGDNPLVVQAQLGTGDVVFAAFDPAAAPLAGWSGAAALEARLVAPAYEAGYDGGSQVVFAGKGFVSTVTNGSAAAFNSTPGAVGPQVTGSALAPYLYQMPGASLPKPELYGLLLLGYVLLIGPASFLVLRKLQRRQLAWVALPCVATAAAVAAYATGAGISRGPLSDEIDVARLAPGSHLVQVTSLGAVYLASGGSGKLALAGDGPVSDLGAGAGASLTVGPALLTGGSPGKSSNSGSGGTGSTGAGGLTTANPTQLTDLTVSGPANSLGGWAATQDALVRGSFVANVVQSGESVSGSATNQLGVGLDNVFIFSATGQQKRVGSLPRGATTRFSFSVPSASTGNGQGPVVVPLFLVNGSAGGGTPRREAAQQGLSELATDYSNSIGGWPVLVGVAHRPFLPSSQAGMPLAATDAVVVPLVPSESPGTKLLGLQPQLSGSAGLTGAVAIGPAGGTLTLAKGGSLDYQFLLPPGRWRSLDLDLGSPNGSPPGPGFSSNFGAIAGLGLASGAPTTSTSDFTLAAFDYGHGSWQPLRTFVGSGSLVGGDFEAVIADPAPYLGPGGALELRLQARVSGLQVFGAMPTLSAFPAP